MTTLLADYDRERQAFEVLLTPDCRKKILFFYGESGCGKTTLLNACLEQVPEAIPYISIQLRGSAVSVAQILYQSGIRLGWERLPHFTREVAALQGIPQMQVDNNWLTGINRHIATSLQDETFVDQHHRLVTLTDAWFQDLEAFDHPVLMVLDNYEQAAVEVAEWISGPFLSRAAQVNPVRVLLTGQRVPDKSIEWSYACTARPLYGVFEPMHWLPIVEAMQRDLPFDDPLSWLAGVCHALKGHPQYIMQVIESLPRREEKV